jgi:hypothetical protein
MILALLLSLLMQWGTRDDVVELRRYLGVQYRTVIQMLDAKNQILLRNTEGLAPAQAAEMRARMTTPDKLPAGTSVLAAKVDNIGQGLVSFLFEDDFITEQVNFVFCPAQGDKPERVLAIQVLLDDSRAISEAVRTLQTIYQLPPPVVPSPAYNLALMYPVRPNLPLTIWNMGTTEAIYQSIPGQQLITGQFWLTDRTVAADCMAIPKL